MYASARSVVRPQRANRSRTQYRATSPPPPPYPATCLLSTAPWPFHTPCHPTPQNVLAKMVIDRVPSVEMVRFVSSGTEACLSVLRLMRAYTGREKVLKFTGCYHGHADSFLVKAGSGVITLGLPDSPGKRFCKRVRSSCVLMQFADFIGAWGQKRLYPHCREQLSRPRKAFGV